MNSASFIGFQPISLDTLSQWIDGMAFDTWTSSQYSVVNLLTSACKYHYAWLNYQGHTVIYNAKDDVLGVPNLAQMRSEDLLHLSNLGQQLGQSGHFYLVDTDFVATHPELQAHFSIEVDEEFADHFFLTREVFEMRGGHYERKRNMVAQFRHHCPAFTVRMLTPADGPACRSLFATWLHQRTISHPELQAAYATEYAAFECALAGYEAMQLEGLGLFDGQQLRAFSLHNRHCPETVIVHFLKYDPAIKGSCEAMVWQLAGQLQAGCTYLNFEQDMGLPGLRQFKHSYPVMASGAPLRLIRKPRTFSSS